MGIINSIIGTNVGRSLLASILVLFFLIIVSVKTYLFLGRKLPNQRKLIWLAAKFVFPAVIAPMTLLLSIYDWYKGVSMTNVYLSYLIFIYSVMGAVDNKKEYNYEVDKINEIEKQGRKK